MSKNVVKYSNKSTSHFGDKVTLVKGEASISPTVIEKMANLHNNLGQKGCAFIEESMRPTETCARAKLDTVDTFDPEIGNAIASCRSEIKGIKNVKKSLKFYVNAIQSLLDYCNKVDAGMDARIDELDAIIRQYKK